MPVVLIFRRRQPEEHFSIERSFGALLPEFARLKHTPFPVQTVEAVCASKRFWPRLRILAQMSRLRSGVFHLTGDIHFAALALPGRKTVLTIHDCGFLQHPNPVFSRLLYFFWLKWPVQHCRLITTVSEATKAEIVQQAGCRPDKIAVVPSAIPPHFRPTLKPFHAEKPRILHIGSAPNKNLIRHIEALRGFPCVLHIVATLRQSEKKLLEETSISYENTPDLDDAGIVRAYENCDLLLFASTLEGFGMPIIEAQTMGRPVVTANCSSMPEVAGAGACLVNPFDPASIRDGILRVVRDADYRNDLVQRGFENARRFQAATIAEKYAQLYRSIHTDG